MNIITIPYSKATRFDLVVRSLDSIYGVLGSNLIDNIVNRKKNKKKKTIPYSMKYSLSPLFIVEEKHFLTRRASIY
jgi:hypothetical protein